MNISDSFHFGHQKSEGTLLLSTLPFLFPIKLLVQKEDEQIDVNFGFIKHLHDGHAFVLQLQQVLDIKYKSCWKRKAHFSTILPVSRHKDRSRKLKHLSERD